MTKAEARKLYLEKRMALTDAKHEELSRIVFANSIHDSSDVKKAKTIHTFISMKRTREFDTKWLFGLFSHQKKRIVVPRVNPDGTMQHFYYEHPGQLVENRFGIPEPYAGVIADIKEIDLVFVPLLAFDVDGNRVGYGKGYYDRFLKDCRPDCIKAGISFFTAEKKFSDVEKHDVRLNICFTPYQTYTFRP
ncbi:MAG: 5-formyltetrahydrofolate cyclo-ligase [Bacteroidota bacterium]